MDVLRVYVYSLFLVLSRDYGLSQMTVRVDIAQHRTQADSVTQLTLPGLQPLRYPPLLFFFVHRLV